MPVSKEPIKDAVGYTFSGSGPISRFLICIKAVSGLQINDGVIGRSDGRTCALSSVSVSSKGGLSIRSERMMNNQAAHTGFHMPHIGSKVWKLLSSALMASTVIAGGIAAAFAQASLSKGETDNPLQASEQMTRTEVERLSHDHWLGYNLMKLAADPHIQQQLEHLHTTAEDFKIPEIKSFLNSMQGKTHHDQIEAVDEFVNQSITLDKSGSLDQWQSFREIFDRKTGDSIDYVIAKGTLLGKLGFSPEDRAIVLGSTEIREHHAVLGVRDTSGKWNILDNRSETV